jgi:site-specific DNA-methyltransferase (adenine-specific)
MERLIYEYPTTSFGTSAIIHADCFEWLGRLPENTLHAIVTDPPYGVKEYEDDQLEKRTNGNGGVWRIPPSYDGANRAPLPRFTAFSTKEREALRSFFITWSKLVVHALCPGAHVFIAASAYLAQLTFGALTEGGLEYRGQVIRLVRTLRGGNRPKNDEDAFPNVCSMLRGCYEPWGILRKPMPPGMTVGDCLRKYGTGGLRVMPSGLPLNDVIESERTPQSERRIADHPSLKPQSFLRPMVYAALPLGTGVIADPFLGAGPTVAAAMAMGVACVGVERRADYYEEAVNAIPKLAALPTTSDVLALHLKLQD